MLGKIQRNRWFSYDRSKAEIYTKRERVWASSLMRRSAPERWWNHLYRAVLPGLCLPLASYLTFFHSWPVFEQRMLKLPHNCTHLTHLQPGFSNTWTLNFQMFKLDLEKAEEPEIKLPISVGSSKKQGSSRKTSFYALLTMPKPLTVWITTNCGKFWKRWDYQTTWPASWETYMQVRKQQLELDIEQQTDSK